MRFSSDEGHKLSAGQRTCKSTTICLFTGEISAKDKCLCPCRLLEHISVPLLTVQCGAFRRFMTKVQSEWLTKQQSAPLVDPADLALETSVSMGGRVTKWKNGLEAREMQIHLTFVPQPRRGTGNFFVSKPTVLCCCGQLFVAPKMSHGRF